VAAGSDLAERLYKAGEKAERAGDVLHAYLLYARASALEPKNVAYAARKNALRVIATLSAKESLGPDEFGATPGGDVETVTGRDMLDSRAALPPPRLSASAEQKTFDLRGDARSIYEKVAEAYGLLVVFEADYQSPPPFTFRLNNAGYEEAFHALEMVSNSFLVPVNAKLALVIRDTPQKRAEMAPAMSMAIPIPERVTAQEATEIVQAVQQALDIRRVTLDAGKHTIYVRDNAAKVQAARLIAADLSRARAQVAVDVELLSVDKNSSLNYGLQTQTSFPIVNFGHFMNNIPSIPAGFRTFMTFGGGSTLFGIGIAQASAFATLAKSRTDNLLDAQIVSVDGQAATLHVGNRYPIITNGYYGNTTGTGTVYAPPPTVNYEDLGLVLKITPSAHEGGEISLDIDTTFKVIVGNSAISGIPIISSRKFTGKVRLKQDEWGVVAGLVSLLESDSSTGLAGVSSIPWIGRLLRQNTIEKDSTQMMLLLKPHLTTLPPWERLTRTIWVGTESRPITLY
jgi:general secretion pathway protein D